MGYKIKIQKVNRPTNNSYYVNFPVAIAEALEVEKGEVFEWFIEDKNTLIFKLCLHRPERNIKLEDNKK